LSDVERRRTTREIRNFIKLECPRYRKARELVPNSDEEGDEEVILVENMNWRHLLQMRISDSLFSGCLDARATEARDI